MAAVQAALKLAEYTDDEEKAEYSKSYIVPPTQTLFPQAKTVPTELTNSHPATISTARQDHPPPPLQSHHTIPNPPLLTAINQSTHNDITMISSAGSSSSIKSPTYLDTKINFNADIQDQVHIQTPDPPKTSWTTRLFSSIFGLCSFSKPIPPSFSPQNTTGGLSYSPRKYATGGAQLELQEETFAPTHTSLHPEHLHISHHHFPHISTNSHIAPLSDGDNKATLTTTLHPTTIPTITMSTIHQTTTPHLTNPALSPIVPVTTRNLTADSRSNNNNNNNNNNNKSKNENNISNNRSSHHNLTPPELVDDDSITLP